MIEQIPHPIDWWKTIPDPAPFCKDCKKGKYPPDPRSFRKEENT